MSQVTESNIVSINQLNPYSQFTIKARCTNKGQIRKYTNNKGEGKFFTFDLVDSSGEIRVTCFNEVADIFEPQIHANSVYLVSKGQIKPGNPRFTKAPYEITLNAKSTIQQVDENVVNIPKMRYSFISIDHLQDVSSDIPVDILGIIINVNNVVTITTKKDQKDVQKRSVELTDKSNRTVELTLWAEQAESFAGIVGDVLAVKNARINDFQGFKKLSVNQFEVNPAMEPAKELKRWYQNNSETIRASARSISQGGPHSGGAAISSAPYGTLKDLKEAGLASQDEKGVYFKINTTVMLIKHDENAPLFYKAVPTGSGHKVVENSTNPTNGKPWFCPALNQFFDSYVPRLILSMTVADLTGSQFVNCFDDCAKIFIGCDAHKIEELKNKEDDEGMKKIFEDSLFKRHTLKLRAKEEIYGDEKRLKCNVAGAELLDFVQESRNLINRIEALSSGKD